MATKTARLRSRSKYPTSEYGMCKREVRECFAVESDGCADAIGAWNESQYKHRETDIKKIPRNVPIFWSGGSEGHGHIAIATGFGKCWSTDILRAGYFDRVPISLIHEKWGLTLLGWTPDLEGERVYYPKKKKS